MKRISEQINYGNRPERMDPRLERKLADPESLYAKNPAIRGGAADVQKLVSRRFTKVAEKLSRALNIPDLSSQQVQQMLMGEMMNKARQIMTIESRFVPQLEQLAIQASLDETEFDPSWAKLEAYLNRSPEGKSRPFKLKPSKEEPKIPGMDIESDFEEEDNLELERHKRNIVNAIVQGSAKKGHYIFQKPEVKAQLDRLNPQLYQLYLQVMAINDFFYFTQEQMIEMMSSTGSGVAGKVQLDDADEDDEEEGENETDTIIRAQGAFFPIVCHELIKGIEEVRARYSLPTDPGEREKVTGVTDILPNEPMQLRIGPEIIEKLRFALPDEIYEDRGLINWFFMELYQIPAKEFLVLIGDVISDDQSKVKQAVRQFEFILRDAKRARQEYEDQMSGNDSDSGMDDEGDIGYDDGDDNGDDDDGLDDLLGGIGGISRSR